MKKYNSAKGQVVREICKPYRWQIMLLSLMTVLQSVCQVGLAVLMRFVIDAAVSSDGLLVVWSAVLAADIALLILLHCAISWQRTSAVDRFSGALRKDILRSVVFCKDSLIRQAHSGVLLSRGMEDAQTMCDGVINALPALIGQVAQLLAAVIAVVLLYPSLAIILLLAVIVVSLTAACLRPVLRKYHRRVRQADERVMATMQEDLQQLELIQSLQIQKPILQRFSGEIKNSLLQKLKRRLWSVGSNGLIHAVAQIGAGVLLIWGAAQMSVGAMSYGTLLSMLQLATIFRGPALGLSALWTRFAAIDVAAERLQDLLRSTEEILCNTQDLDVSTVVFEDVTFTYPGDTNPALENFSIQLPLDGWACLTGFSGKGKSTLFKLILGLYTPEKGSVYLKTNQGDILCTEATRSLFAYVPQDYALFSGTVLENLQLVAPQATQDQLEEALDIAQAAFILEMPDGLQTQLGENNTGLSMGQLQRLAIARAVLMERPVFLLDECTSALDAETEKAVLSGLQAMGHKAVLVTHRPEALTDINNITAVSMEK